MYFWTYGLRKTLLDNGLKSPVSEDPSASNIVNGPKYYRNLNDRSFTKFIDNCEGNSGWRSLSEWYAQSKDCLLTHWLPITGFLSLIETIYSNIFWCIHLRNEMYLPHFFFAFWKFKFNFEHVQQKDDPHSLCIFELRESEKRG